ncbi:dTMP kinase [[Acholeplasma] multilocale]|uniref:dTMP kinase n=1 Tax=[Acholeplasma] multilocale TaxID=264638 RepID=UPI00041353B2|nr:dTMP kinase [[Acholeplasma] multilocale]
MFISLEGMDGSGKSTAIAPIKEFLEQLGHEVVLTREPGGIKVAEEIRDVILTDHSEGMDGLTEALLFIAARREHLVKVIAPALKRGAVVISDRFMDSTTVYQGQARGVGVEKLDQIQNIVLEGFKPDLTIYFDLRLDEAEKRINGRVDEMNRLDREQVEFKQKVMEGYKALINKYPDRFEVIDANLGIEEVQQETRKIIVEALAKYENKHVN